MYLERSTSRVSAWRRSDERCVTKNDHSDRAIARCSRSRNAMANRSSRMGWYVRFARSSAARAHDTTMKTATTLPRDAVKPRAVSPRATVSAIPLQRCRRAPTRGSAATGGATAHRTPRSTRRGSTDTPRPAIPSEARGRSPAEKSTPWRRSSEAPDLAGPSGHAADISASAGRRRDASAPTTIHSQKRMSAIEPAGTMPPPRT